MKEKIPSSKRGKLNKKKTEKTNKREIKKENKKEKAAKKQVIKAAKKENLKNLKEKIKTNIQKNKRTYKMISFGANALFIGFISFIFGYNHYDVARRDKLYNSMEIAFVETKEVEYGSSNYDTMKLIEKIENGKIIDYTKELDTTEIGIKEVKYELGNQDVTKEYTVRVEVKDTSAPIIEITNSVVTIYQGNDYDPNDNIATVSDAVDGGLMLVDAPPAENTDGYFLINTDFDKDSIGSYNVDVIAVDKNGNQSSDNFTIKVIAKPVRKSYATGNYNGPSSAPAGSVVEEALRYVGYRYKSGGNNPGTGFDCSGFVNYVYGRFGVYVGRSAGAILYDGYAVSEGNMQPGDIIVWTNLSSGAATHVGIYIGGNQMVHAANYRLGVVVSDLDYWKGGGRNRIISIRRV